MFPRLLWHLTPLSNLPSIARHGLLPVRARTLTECVWLMRHASIARRQLHIARSQNVIVPHLVRLQVQVEPRFLRRFRLWSFCYMVPIPVSAVHQCLMLHEDGTYGPCHLWSGLVSYGRYLDETGFPPYLCGSEVDFWTRKDGAAS